ncbi:Alpha/Beta hydrolase protein [Xylariales sp. PMI_506]|nr:Alpha/Beta hydrolase protein [Xylariales sp. PMI_506]
MANNDDAQRGEDFSIERLTQRYRFDDTNMDLFFLAALGWGSAGGLSIGEAFYVASKIKNGDPDSWSVAFEQQAEVLVAQAAEWLQRGRTLAAGEARLKAFSCYRSSWQFVSPGERFAKLFHTSQKLFDQAMGELSLPVTRFTVPYGGGELPGHFYRASNPAAPTILVIGGADTCNEDRFLSQGRYYLDRGYSVVVVDLPGQGIVMEQGLHWEPETERPIAAVVDELVARFGVEPRKLVLLGMSLGGYFACRAAAHEPRFAAIIATPALPRPGELFAGIGKEAQKNEAAGVALSEATVKNFEVLMWKAGVTSFQELLKRWYGVVADPANVQVPFFSVLGKQEGRLFQKQTEEWHAAIPSAKKRLVNFDADTGADAHCQGNNPLRLVQEVDAWLHEVLPEEY